VFKKVLLLVEKEFHIIKMHGTRIKKKLKIIKDDFINWFLAADMRNGRQIFMQLGLYEVI